MITFVDTSVLVYAHDTDDEKRSRAARRCLTALWDSGDGVLSTQVLQEFYAVATRKMRPPISRAKARAIVAAYGEWCRVQIEAQLIVAASRLEENHSLSFWDALIVEAALRSRAERLLSEDMHDGLQIGSLTIENPFRSG